RIVKPAFVIESDRFGDKGIALPLPNGISEPARIGLRRKAAAIRKDLPVVIELFIEDHNDAGSLNDFEWRISHQHSVRNAMRNTLFGGTAFAEGICSLLVERCGPRLKRSLSDLGGDVLQIPSVGDSPNAGQVGLAVRALRRRSRKVRLAVGGSRRIG